MIQKVLKKILLWLFDSGNNKVFAKAINDIENEIVQKNKVMKANEAPKKIWIDPATDFPKLSGHINKDSIEYIKKDAFIEKACVWLKNNLQGIVGGSIYIEDFINYMKGE